MVRLTLITSLLALFLINAAFGQNITFLYDTNGNRTSRMLTVEPIQNSINLPFRTSKAFNANNDTQSESQKSKEEKIIDQKKAEDQNIKPIIYPNPTKGLLRVSVQNLPENARTEMRIYDLNGNQLLIEKDFGYETELDISRNRDGIYFLRLQINNLIFNWKVIKSSR